MVNIPIAIPLLKVLFSLALFIDRSRIHLLFHCLSPSTFQLAYEFHKVRDVDVLFTDRSSVKKKAIIDKE